LIQSISVKYTFIHEDISMKKVKKGDRVTIEYEGMLEDGEIIESSADTGPFELEVGGGAMPPGFENALIDMNEGEEKTVVLQPDEAFGHKDENLLHTVNKSVFGENVTPKTGMILGMTVDKDGEKQKIPAVVTEVKDEEVTIDFNHPLAGKAITYKFTVKTIR
jgi:FKBP-type peptidyl-prolyl cis-trans isomerase 2